MKRIFQLWAQFIRTTLIRDMEYRTQFFVNLSVNFVWILVMFAIAELFFLHTDFIVGWSKIDIYILIVTWAVVHELFNALFWQGLSRISDTVHSGDLDNILTKPMHSILQLAFSRLSVSHCIQTLIHLALLIFFIIQSEITVTLFSVILFVTLCFCALVIFFAIHLFLQSLSFWFIYLDNIKYLFYSITEIGRYPAAVFKGAQIVLFTIIPIGFVGNAQALFLLGEGTIQLYLATLGAAILFILFAVGMFTLGARNYTSASS